MLKITVLNDNRNKNEDKFFNSHGLSLLIEKDDFRFLFDVGKDDNFLKNSKTLNIDLKDINQVVLSHGHYDHTDGLKFMNNLKIIAHPGIFIWRRSKRTGGYCGFPFSEKEAHLKFDFVLSKEPYKIEKDIYFLGEIERKNDFECKKFPSVLKDESDDIAVDDTGIVIKINDGIIVVSGCGHSGICNTIEYAKKLTKCDKIIAVIGGFHLKEIDLQVEKTVEYFKNQNIENVYLAHCTSDNVCEYFIQNLSNSTNIDTIYVGKTIEF